jgi:PAS domain S-box-containing protein
VNRKRATYQGLLEAAPDAIIGVGVDGAIVLLNAQAERLFCYERAELIGQSIELLVPESARAIHPALREGYVSDPAHRQMGAALQLSARRKDGTEFPAEITLSALETDEGLLVSAAVRDVTDRIYSQLEREHLLAEVERQRYEGQLHLSQRIQSLGHLAGGIAHDFNNLLSAILNYNALVHHALAAATAAPDGEHWAQSLHDVEQVRRATERGIELTKRLLAFSRDQVTPPRVVQVNAIVSDIAELLNRTLGEHIDLVVSLDTDLPAVLADSGQLEQVLLNLAVNARDAMPDGGQLVIETTATTIDLANFSDVATPGAYVRLRVRDTGLGMPDDVAKRAFEPFFTTKSEGEGSGLGLAIVYGIITQAGGHVELTSSVGGGTTITTYLPATEAPVADIGARPSAPVDQGAGETVLLVEDDALVREVVDRILSSHNYEVLVASSGIEAIALASAHKGRIDLLLTDVVMPNMRGTEVAEQVRALAPRVRVLYMSGHVQPLDLARRNLIVSQLIEKPFTGPDLLSRVRSELDRP